MYKDIVKITITPLLLLVTASMCQGETLHSKARKNELESFSRKCLGEDVSQLIFNFHKV